jgi:hypothetical protein
MHTRPGVGASMCSSRTHPVNGGQAESTGVNDGERTFPT